MMKKIIFILFCGLLSFSCESQNTSINNSENTKHLIVNGKPFLMLGAQLRTDLFLQLDKKTPDELDPYFKLAAGINIKVIQVPIAWKDIEKQKDVYDGSLVEKYIELCDKYKLKLEILWFGSYMCGYSVEGYIPDYVVNATSTYPELKPSADYEGWLGKQYYLKPNTPALVERESMALQQMMDIIYNYDSSHNFEHTVIGIQIENEPDMLATRHNQNHGYSPEQIWPDLLSMLDKLGQVVKNSKYQCYTRVNQTTTYSNYMEMSSKIVKTKGIDYVGIDPYENDIAGIGAKLKQLSEFNGNYAHIAENGGEFMNNDLLALKAITLGCGYDIFEVITTPNPKLKDMTLRGIYNPDFTPKPQTERVIDAFKIYKGAWVDLASAESNNIVGFNLKNDDGLDQTTESEKTENVIIQWETKDRGVAFAVEKDNHLTVASTKNDIMNFSNINILSAEKGYYDDNGTWVNQGEVNLSNKQLILDPCVIYKIQFVKQ